MQDHLVDIHRNIALGQNEPDPFRTTTLIPFTIRVPGVVSLTILDLQGKEIKTVLHEWRPPGEHRIEFDGRGFPEGLYVCRLSFGEVHKSKTMLLLR